MKEHEKINYVEWPAKDLSAIKSFFTKAFNWEFTDYGDLYVGFTGQGLDGGFFKSDQRSAHTQGSALVVFYSKDLAQTQAKIEDAGGKIVKPVFAFPGGRRFHFSDPNGNEYGVWSDLDAEGKPIELT